MAYPQQPPVNKDTRHLIDNAAPTPEDPPPAYYMPEGQQQYNNQQPPAGGQYPYPYPTQPGYTQQPGRPGQPPYVAQPQNRVVVVQSDAGAVITKWYRTRAAIWGIIVGIKLVILIVVLAVVFGSN